MENKVLKTAVKVIGAVCVASGIVAVGSVLASKKAFESITKSFKSAKDTAKDILNDNKKDKELVVYEIKETDDGNQVLEVQEENSFETL